MAVNVFPIDPISNSVAGPTGQTARDLGVAVGPIQDEAVAVGDGDREAGDRAVATTAGDLGIDHRDGGIEVGRSAGSCGHGRYDASMEPTRRVRRAATADRDASNGSSRASAFDAGADMRPRSLPRSRDASRDRRRRGECPLPGARRRGRPDHRRRRDGDDALRQRPPVRRPTGDLEPGAPGRHPAHPARLPRGRFAILLTNTFGGNRARLRLSGHGDRVDDFNRTAAILLRAEVEAAGGNALVAGDIGPTGEIVEPLGTLAYDEAVDIFREQAASLVAGGVDLIWVETMSDLREIRAAIEGVRQASPGIALVATMTFDTRGHTMMGVTPEEAVGALHAWGADAIGGNCGNGPDELVPVIAKMRAAAPDVVLVAKSNAGMPELIDMRAVYRADPETMAGQVLEMRDAGATILGGCCGSTPDHLRAIAAAVRPA